MQGFIRNPKTGWRNIGQETIILDFQKKRLIGLNESAGWIWSQLEVPRTSTWLASHFAGITEQPKESTVCQFLQEMVELELLIQQRFEMKEEPASLKEFSLKPGILWQEPLQQVAGTCALVSGQSILCNQAPFS